MKNNIRKKSGPQKNTSLCLATECNRIYYAIGLCRIHYHRWRKRGSLDCRIVINNIQEKLKYYSKINENGCWEWQRAKIHNGYGRVYVKHKNKDELTHRASWEAFVGEIKEGMQINHKCHNRACINPDHLYLGTQKENVRDMLLAGRGNVPKGSDCINSKLTEDKVKLIKKMLNEGKRSCDIAIQFNISRSTIWNIKYGKTWKHII